MALHIAHPDADHSTPTALCGLSNSAVRLAPYPKASDCEPCHDAHSARIQAIHDAAKPAHDRRERFWRLAKSALRTKPTLDDELTALADLRDAIDAHAADLVAAARYNGESWTQIGNALGITKQAAQQRYNPKPTPVTTDEAQEPLPGVATR